MRSVLMFRLFSTSKIASKSGPKQFNLVNRKADVMQKIPPNVKKILDMQMPDNDFI